jgi:DNA-directed RNA polymerase specialized sigma24 family protein
MRCGGSVSGATPRSHTFAIAWRRLDALPADPLPWLLGVARHVIQNEARSARRTSNGRLDPHPTLSRLR